MGNKISYVLGKVIGYILLIALLVIISVLAAAVVNRLLLWGFPSYGC